MSYLINKSTVEENLVSIPSGNKKSIILSGTKEGPYSTAIVVADDILPKAEVHEESADVWQVIRGEATFIIGGKLEDPSSHKPKEWIAETISGGQEYSAGPGDMIDIPPGVPHQIDARGKRIELLIVKVNNLKA